MIRSVHLDLIVSDALMRGYGFFEVRAIRFVYESSSKHYDNTHTRPNNTPHSVSYEWDRHTKAKTEVQNYMKVNKP